MDSAESAAVTEIPCQMRAAVYRGPNRISIENVPVPAVDGNEILVKVHSCGVCATDLKKIEHGLVPPPRIFGHEIAGTVVRTGASVTRFKPGNRVAVHHHVPCRRCFYCRRKLYSQCPGYRRTGTTAGFEPAGGGFAEYVRVMDWVVAEGVVPVPDHVTHDQASFLEPLNTCLKALETAALQAGETVVVFGQGPVGLLLTQVAAFEGAAVVALDLMPERRSLCRKMGARAALDPAGDGLDCALADMTEGRGADLAIVATAAPAAINAAQKAVRRGGRVLLFAQTMPGETASVDTSSICMEEKQLIGSYSSSVELQQKAAELVFSGRIDVERLVTHRFPLESITDAIELASHPSETSLKVLIQP